MCKYMSKVKNKMKKKIDSLTLVVPIHKDPSPALNALVLSILNFPLYPA